MQVAQPLQKAGLRPAFFYGFLARKPRQIYVYSYFFCSIFGLVQ